MPYGLTPEQVTHLSTRLSEILGVEVERVDVALGIITCEEVRRIAKNDNSL